MRRIGVPALAVLSALASGLACSGGAPELPSPAPCSHDLGSTRLGAWANRLSDASLRTVAMLDDACVSDVQELTGGHLLHHLFVDGASECLPSPVVRSADGGDACMVTATIADDGPCAAHPGMIEPRKADGVRRGIAPSEGQRVCEVQRLTASAANACRTGDSCSGCTAGWCVADLRPRAPLRCPTLRLVKGAIPIGAAAFDFVCDLASP